MFSYLTAFIFYTFAMVGILLLAFVIYKKMNINTQQQSKGTIKIIDSCPIGAKKTLLVIKIKNEKFLIASGMEHTTFLAKLDDEIQPLLQEELDPSYVAQNDVIGNSDDAYDFLYQQQKFKEIQPQININQNNNEIMQNAQNSLDETRKQLQSLYSTNNSFNNKINEAFKKRSVMKKLLDDIQDDRKVSGSRF